MRNECAAITPLENGSGIKVPAIAHPLPRDSGIQNSHSPRPLIDSGIQIISATPLPRDSGIQNSHSPRPLIDSGIQIISASAQTPVNTGQPPLKGSTSPAKKSSLKHKGDAEASNLRSTKLSVRFNPATTERQHTSQSRFSAEIALDRLTAFDLSDRHQAHRSPAFSSIKRSQYRKRRSNIGNLRGGVSNLMTPMRPYGRYNLGSAIRSTYRRNNLRPSQTTCCLHLTVPGMLLDLMQIR